MSITCRWISVRAPTEWLLIVRCVLRSGKVLRKLYSNTENYLTINMKFYLMDVRQFCLLPNCMDWERFLFVLLFPLPPRVLQQTGSEFSVRQWSHSGFKSWSWCLEAVLCPGTWLNSLAELPWPAGAVSCTSPSLLFLTWSLKIIYAPQDLTHPILDCVTCQPCRLTWLYLHSHTHTKLTFHTCLCQSCRADGEEHFL